MTYKKFYSRRLDEHILNNIDENHKTKMKFLIEDINRGSWTKKQKKMQKSHILSNIALYKCLTDSGIPKSEAKELIKEYSFYCAKKIHKFLKTVFHIPGFFALFRFFMTKSMSGDEIWKSKILSNNDTYYRVDIFKCLWSDTCEHFGCPELCEIFCLCDHIMFGNIDGFIFERSQTLGMNGEKCDFCFINEKEK